MAGFLDEIIAAEFGKIKEAALQDEIDQLVADDGFIENNQDFADDSQALQGLPEVGLPVEQEDFGQEPGLGADTQLQFPQDQSQLAQALSIRPRAQRQPPLITHSRRGVNINPAGVQAETERLAQPFEEAVGAQKQARQQVSEAEQAANQVKAQGFADEATMIQEQAIELKDFDAKVAEEADKRLEVVRDLSNKAASFTVDRNRIWNESSNAGKLAGAAAAFIGGFLAPVLGRNDIQAMLEKGIDRDIAQQQGKKASLEKQIGRELQFDAIAKSNSANERAYLSTQQLYRAKALQAQVNAQITGANNPILAAKAQEFNAALDVYIADREHSIFNETRNHANQQQQQKRAQLNADRAARLAAARLRQRKVEFAAKQREVAAKKKAAAAKAKADASKESFADALPKSIGLRTKSGGLAKIGNDVARRNARETFTGLNNNWNALEAIIRNGDFSKFKVPGSDTHRMMQQYAPQIAMAGNNGKLGGQFSQADFENTVKAAGAGDTDAWIRFFGSEENFKKRLRSWQSSLVRNGKATARGFVDDKGSNLEWSPAEDKVFLAEQESFLGEAPDVKAKPSRQTVNETLNLGQNITDFDDRDIYLIRLEKAASALKDGKLSSADGTRLVEQAEALGVGEEFSHILDPLKSAVDVAQKREKKSAVPDKKVSLIEGPSLTVGGAGGGLPFSGDPRLDISQDPADFQKEEGDEFLTLRTGRAQEGLLKFKAFEKFGINYTKFRGQSEKELSQLPPQAIDKLFEMAKLAEDTDMLKKLDNARAANPFRE